MDHFTEVFQRTQIITNSTGSSHKGLYHIGENRLYGGSVLFKGVKQTCTADFFPYKYRSTPNFLGFLRWEVSSYIRDLGGGHSNDLFFPERSSAIISGKRKCIPEVVDSCHSEDVLERISWASSSSRV